MGLYMYVSPVLRDLSKKPGHKIYSSIGEVYNKEEGLQINV